MQRTFQKHYSRGLDAVALVDAASVAVDSEAGMVK
jgi:hypothetical protein